MRRTAARLAAPRTGRRRPRANATTMSPTRAAWDIARSTGQRARGAESRGCSRISGGAARDRPARGVGRGDGARGRRRARASLRGSRARHGTSRSSRARRRGTGAAASRAERGRRVDGAAAVVAVGTALRHAPPSAPRYGQISCDVRSAGSAPRASRRRHAAAGGDGRVRRVGPLSDGHGHGQRPITARPRPRTVAERAPETQKSWRRPIFPKGCPLSIFGAGELDFRVRDGNGYGLSARVTRIRCVWMSFGSGPRAARHMSTRGAPIVDLRSRVSQSGTDPDFPATDPWSVAEEVKPSTISTAQLHPSPDFHMRPIKQVVSLRSYPVDPVGNLISRRASHLDAFSAYPDRT